MGRITVDVAVNSTAARAARITVKALVDTGASHLVLPMSLKGQLGRLKSYRTETTCLADGHETECLVGGPVQIAIDGCAPIYSEVVFVEMNGGEPLLGYIPLEQSRLVVDMAHRRLIQVKHFDLKKVK